LRGGSAPSRRDYSLLGMGGKDFGISRERDEGGFGWERGEARGWAERGRKRKEGLAPILDTAAPKQE
jgi:hypothetical protein